MTENYIKQQIRFRMGYFFDTKFNFPMIFKDKPILESNYFIIINNKIILRQGHRKAHSGVGAFLNDSNSFQHLPNNCPILLYFADTRGCTGFDFPVFNFNRHIKINNLCLLHWDKITQDKKLFTINDKYKWDNKIEKLIWRGSMNGRIIKPNSIITHTMFMAYLCGIDSGLVKDKPQEILSNLLKFPRYSFCNCYKNSSLIDCAFNISAHWEKKNIPINNDLLNIFFKDILTERMSMNEILRYKYQIAIEGNDWSSSLPWLLYNDCVVLIPPITYNSIYTSHLEPWVHFVPIKEDFSDVEDKIKYLKQNDNLSKEISKNATNYIEPYLDKNIQDKINKGIYDKYMENCINIKEILHIFNKNT